MREFGGIRITPPLLSLPDPIYGSNWTDWHLNWVQTNDLYYIELLKIELFDYLTVCKQMSDV